MRILLIVSFITILLPCSIAADTGFGIGAMGTVGLEGNVIEGGAVLVVSPPIVPLMFNLGWKSNSGISFFTLSADWWLLQTDLVSILSLYAGPGIGTEFGDADADAIIFSLTVRAPAGLQIFLGTIFELFVELTPGVRIRLLPDFIPNFIFHSSLGARFWF